MGDAELAGAEYAPTGPQPLTVSEVADIIADVIGGPVTHAPAWTLQAAK